LETNTHIELTELDTQANHTVHIFEEACQFTNHVLFYIVLENTQVYVLHIHFCCSCI